MKLTPSEIKRIRKKAGLSQSEFAKKLRFGIATIKRWELGMVVQNDAADETIRNFAAGDPLLEYCRRFIAEQRIRCAETIYQTDRVIESAYEFIEGICDIVGYVESEAEEEE